MIGGGLVAKRRRTASKSWLEWWRRCGFKGGSGRACSIAQGKGREEKTKEMRVDGGAAKRLRGCHGGCGVVAWRKREGEDSEVNVICLMKGKQIKLEWNN